MKWPWSRRRSESDHGDHVVELAHAENRLRSVEERADNASQAILARHARNHWSETIRQTIREGRA